MTILCSELDSPVGPLWLAERDGGAVLAVSFAAGDRAAFAGDLARRTGADARWTPGEDSRARRQLVDYFHGGRRAFDLELAPLGTPFQQSVWRALGAIPFGSTRSYADIARTIGRPKAVRAVGAANGQNPIVIVVPCHRVIGKDGSLTGYGGGLERKRWLLEWEGAVPSAAVTGSSRRTPGLPFPVPSR